MTNQLDALEDWAAGLLGQLEPVSLNKLVRSIGKALRRSQQLRITAQQNPNGSKYALRKQRGLRNKQGRMKRKLKLFKKLGTGRFLKMHNDQSEIIMGFTGRISRIARVHQFGLKDRAEHNAPYVNYDTREILGLAQSDLNLIRETLAKNIKRN
jgi:phage virion morphogenesis protein